MCRYAIAYKPHYACFECRKTFKRRLACDIEGTTDFTIDAKCPQCGKLTADMGLDFKSPKKSDLKSWKYLKDLFTVGVTFHSCGCNGPGYIPQDKEALIKYLQDKQLGYIKQLRFWLNRVEPKTKKEIDFDKRINWFDYSRIPKDLKGKKGEINNAEAIEYWNQKIKDIQNKIKYLENSNS